MQPNDQTPNEGTHPGEQPHGVDAPNNRETEQVEQSASISREGVLDPAHDLKAVDPNSRPNPLEREAALDDESMQRSSFDWIDRPDEFDVPDDAGYEAYLQSSHDAEAETVFNVDEYTSEEEVQPFVQQLRIPPHSLEAESSVLGGVLLDNSSWDKIGDLLTEEDFYRYEHRLIFGAIYSLMNAARAADTLTVFEHLKSQGKAEEAGNIEYLNSLAQYIPSESNIRRFAEIVRERAMLRKLLSVSEEITTSAMNTGGRPVPTILDEAEQKIFNVGEESARKRQGFQKMDSLGVSLLERVKEMSANPNDVTGVPTGFIDLDKMTSGLQGGDLIVLAARPSMGKTALAINIAEHVALNEGLPVAIFSMEMGASQLVVRIVGSLGRIDQNRLRTGKLQPDEWSRLIETSDRIGKSSMFIDETPGLTPSELRANARRLSRRCGKLGLIVVDYLQLMSGSSGTDSDNRSTELGEISRGLKMLAKELQCPVIALSQLNRGVEQRTDKRPMMSDLRESGAIEQDADVIMFIYRDDYYTKEMSKEPGVAEIIIAKQRNGPTGSVKLAFLKNITKFESLATGYN